MDVSEHIGRLKLTFPRIRTIVRLRKQHCFIVSVWERWFTVISLKGAAEVEENYNCKRFIKQACTHINTHKHSLMLSWRCLTDANFLSLLFFLFNHSIAGWAYNQRQLTWIAGLADSLCDWLVVSLPYSGVYCVNAGLGWRMNSIKVEHMARDGNPLVLWHGTSVVKLISGQVGRVEAPHWLTLKSDITKSARSPSWDSSFVFWSPVYAYSICIFLPWFWRKYIYFL